MSNTGTGSTISVERTDGSAFSLSAGVYSILGTDDATNLYFKTNNAFRQLIASNGDISFYEDTGTTPKFFWDASAESLGIGTSSPDSGYKLDVAGNVVFGDGGGFDMNVDGSRWQFSLGGSEAMRIDSSGRLLVGKTTAGDYVTGVEFQPAGAVLAYRTTGVAGIFGRTNDGEVIRITSNSAVVGSIGATSGDLYIGTGGIAARFDNSLNAITPFNNNTLADSDNVIGIGSSARRFKDLYLSGGVYLGGTTSANLLDDYEEGTWTPVIADAASAGNTSPTSATSSAYTKIGNLVTVQMNIQNVDTTGMTGANNIYITGLPFTVKSLTGSSYFTGAILSTGLTFTGNISVVAEDNFSHILIGETTSGSNADLVTVGEISSGATDLWFSITYMTT